MVPLSLHELSTHLPHVTLASSCERPGRPVLEGGAGLAVKSERKGRRPVGRKRDMPFKVPQQGDRTGEPQTRVGELWSTREHSLVVQSCPMKQCPRCT